MVQVGFASSPTMAPNVEHQPSICPSLMGPHLGNQQSPVGQGGTKQAHVSESLDSGKDSPRLDGGQELALVLIDPDLEGWQKVQQRKGKKEKSSTNGHP